MHPQDGFALLHTLHAAEPTEDITSLAWSPDDSMILLGVECAIKIFDVQVSNDTVLYALLPKRMLTHSAYDRLAYVR